MADFLGSNLKFLVEPSASGFDKSRDNFTVTISSQKKSRTWEKVDLILDQQGNYYVPVDTAFFGTGIYLITVKTYTPDDDFDGGIRVGIEQMELCNILTLRQ